MLIHPTLYAATDASPAQPPVALYCTFEPPRNVRPRQSPTRNFRRDMKISDKFCHVLSRIITFCHVLSHNPEKYFFRPSPAAGAVPPRFLRKESKTLQTSLRRTQFLPLFQP